MMLRQLLLIAFFIFSSFSAWNQAVLDWQPIPVLDTVSYIKKTAPAIVSKQEINKKEYIQFNETKEKPKFIGLLKPKFICNLNFTKIPLIKTEKPFTIDFFRKDNSKLNIKYLDKSHGLPSQAVMSIQGDENNQIYLGTETGLIRYNGSSFEIFNAEKEFSLQTIYCSLMDSKGRLWIGTSNGFAYFENDELFIPNNQIDDIIWNIKEDRNGSIIISTNNNGFFTIEQNKLNQYFLSEYANMIRDCIKATNGRFWMGLNRSVAFLKQDSLFEMNRGDFGYHCTSVYEAGNEIWMGTFSQHLFKFVDDKMYKASIKSRPNNAIYQIEKTDEGLWFSSYGLGMFFISNDNELISLKGSEGLSDRHAYGFYIDSFQNIWVNDAIWGLSRIEKNILLKDRVFDVKRAITDINIKENTIWYFSHGGGFLKEKEGILYNYINKEKEGYLYQSYHLNDGYVVSENEVWMGNLGDGLTLFKDNQFIYYIEKNVSNSGVHQVTVDDKNRVWYISYVEKKLFYFDKKKLFCFNKNKMFEKLDFYQIFNLEEKGIFAVSNDGLRIFKNNQYLVLNEKNGLISNNVKFIKSIGNETYIFTDKGVQVYLNDEAKRIYKTDLFKNCSIHNLIQTDSSFLISSSCGLINLTLNESLKYEIYNNEYGYIFDKLSYIEKINGEILVFGSEQAYRLNSELLSNSRTKPIIFWDKVFVGNNEMNLENIQLNQNEIIDFHIGAINWGQKKEIYFLLEKNGEKGDWRSQKSAKIQFENLSHGSYKLLVKIKGKNNESETLSIDFEILPYWYETTLANFSALLIIILSGILFIQFRMKKAKKNQLKLEAIIEEKTSELKLEKKEVEFQLEQRELLLKEVNHRVKNNMQLVSSILELQQLKTENKKAQEIFKIASKRINSLALAHQSLYRNKDFETINLKEYIEILVRNLSKLEKVDIQISIPESVKIHIEKGQALGFIIHELLTNSLKYAWEDAQKNKSISISLTMNIENECHLIYSDNGIGFPDNFKMESQSSLGSSLITSFIKRQLKGSYSINNKNGACIEMNFPLR